MDFKKETFIYLQLYMRHRQLLYVVQRQCLHVRQSCRVRPLSPLSCVKCAGLTSFQLELQMIMKQHYEWEKYICFFTVQNISFHTGCGVCKKHAVTNDYVIIYFVCFSPPCFLCVHSFYTKCTLLEWSSNENTLSITKVPS